MLEDFSSAEIAGFQAIMFLSVFVHSHFCRAKPRLPHN